MSRIAVQLDGHPAYLYLIIRGRYEDQRDFVCAHSEYLSPTDVRMSLEQAVASLPEEIKIDVVPRKLREGEEPVDEDDYVYERDSKLGFAPEDPGTYECDDAKPEGYELTDPERMNKWCARECERSTVVVLGARPELPDLENPEPNSKFRPVPARET